MKGRDLQRFDASVLILLAIAGVAVPFLLTGYNIKLATTITIQAGLAAALGLVVGPAGLISIGHAAFYGVAAYLFAMIAPQSGPANLLATAFVAIAGTSVWAAIVGAISIRSRGLYFVLMTLAFGQLGYHLFNDTGIGGSADGTYINFRPELRLPGYVLKFEQPVSFYLLALAAVAGVVALCWWLRRSAFGTILIAARDNEVRVRAFGFSPYWFRLAAFIVSGAMAGAMGYLTAAQHGFVTPQMLAWHASATVLVMLLIGGKDTVSGPIVGAILLLIAEEILQRMTEYWLVGVGLIIVAIVIAAPQGLVPLAARAIARFRMQGRHV
ncbi:MAG: branched-chain amino acid ABC transporter permease [Bradyrhizobium sp.]